jgi:NAD(P)-dependent dehydrogenase (short-subunit alcohol dehydrogenase family)
MQNLVHGIKDKVVAITGASSGIREATAVMLAERGARVVLGAGSFRRGIDSNCFDTLRQNSFIQ